MGKPNWMKFDPDKIALDVDGMSLEQEGAYMRCVRHIWRNGPLPEVRLAKVCGNVWEAVKACAAEYEGGLSFSWLEDARTDAQGRSKRASVAGSASFNARSTDVQQPFNGRSTDVLSISKSSSTSESTSQERKERVKPEPKELPFTSDAFAVAWSGFEAMRKKKGKPMTDRARSMILADCLKYGEGEAIKALNASERAGWTDIYPPKEAAIGTHAATLKSASPDRVITDKWD